MTPFTTVLADPGWSYDDKLRMDDDLARSSTDQYQTTQSVDEICALYTPSRAYNDPNMRGHYVPGTLCGFPIAEDVAFLWLWVTNPFLLDGSGVRVCRAWGFEPKQIVPWIKGRLALEPVPAGEPWPEIRRPLLVMQPGMGWVTRGVTEHVIIATRGRYTKALKVKNEPGIILAPDDAVIIAPRGSLADGRKHSVKPKIHDKIERVCPGPYLELFARESRAGWTTSGDELTDAPSAAMVEEMEWP